ncbi:MAG: glycerol dehydratase reactivase beta/small subunit family protein [Bacillota bacterium]
MQEDRHTATAPSIKIYTAGNAGTIEGFSDMLYGIEEEGIPFEIVPSSLTDIRELAYEAALSSSLSVGLGINADEVALHFDKLPRSAPLYIINREVGRRHMRSMGINAARLVKRMPFNDINQ